MSVTNESLPTEKWIFSYRREGTRELSEEERTAFRKVGSQQRLVAIEFAGLSVVLFAVALACVSAAAGGHPLWWARFVGGIVGFFWMLSISTRQDSRGVLYRRAARKGQVDRYVPGVRPEGFESINTQLRDESDPDDRHLDWQSDERFEESLARVAGQRPAWFETPAGDPVVLSVEGRHVKSVLNGYPAFFRTLKG